MWYTLPELIRSQTFHSESPSRTSWPLFRGRFGDLLGSCRALLVENLPPMKTTIAALAAALFLFPSLSMAAGLNYQQASSIIVLLEAFSVNQATINEVWGFIQPEDTPLTPPTVATTQDTSPSLQPVFGGTLPSMNDIVEGPNQPVEQSAPVVDPTIPVITADFVSQAGVGPDILSDADATSSLPYKIFTAFELHLTSQTTPLSQIAFSVVMPDGITTSGVDHWLGDGGEVGPPYTSGVQMVVRASVPGTYPIVITATDPSGATASKTLTVVAH